MKKEEQKQSSYYFFAESVKGKKEIHVTEKTEKESHKNVSQNPNQIVVFLKLRRS